MESDSGSCFPLEILDVVVDHLHDDATSLAACGLAGRSLLSSSRYHLFSCIRLTSSNLASFLELLARPSIANLASLTRKLVADGLFPCVGDENTTRCNMSRALDVMLHLRSVTFFSIIDLNMNHMMTHESTLHSHILAMLSYLPDVLNLDLTAVEYHKGDCLFDLILSFPKLQSLSMRECCWDEHLSSTTVQRLLKQTPFYLRELDLFSADIFARQVMPHVEFTDGHVWDIQCSRLSCDFFPDASVQRFISAIAWSIRELDVCRKSIYHTRK